MWWSKITHQQAFMKFLEAVLRDEGSLSNYGQAILVVNTISYPNQPDKSKETYMSITMRADDECAGQLKQLLQKNDYVDQQTKI